MGQIGRWIDERCKREPGIMRHVLNRSFGPLSYFVTLDGRDEKCGCLIGSYGLVRGERWAHTVEIRDGKRWAGVPPRGRWYNHPWREAREVGFAVNNLCYWKGRTTGVRKRPDEVVIRLIKQRIRKSLGLAPAPRETAVEEAVA